MNAENSLIQLIGHDLKLKQIRIDDFLINYVEIGTGPNLLLLHGANMGWGQWYPNLKKLSEYFNIFALDLPGAGSSSWIHPRNLEPQKHWVDIVEKFIKLKLKKGASINIVAHSIGGWIALKLALKEQSFINKLVLVSPLGFSEYTPKKYRFIGLYIFAQLLSMTFMRPTRKNIKRFIQDVFYDVSSLKEEFIDYYYESLKKNKFSHPFLLLNRIAGFWKVRNVFVLLSELSKIKIPTLIIVGDKDPILPLNSLYLKAFRLIVGARLEIFLNCGHVPSTEKSNKFNELVINFLKF
ncbi:MAG: alpha/beta hydrolase [Candidatus Brennerbacteria bacterium]|nr:alpha/beta hydrolase [Candidatus Brennerbacteria bacterium]